MTLCLQGLLCVENREACQLSVFYVQQYSNYLSFLGRFYCLIWSVAALSGPTTVVAQEQGLLEAVSSLEEELASTEDFEGPDTKVVSILPDDAIAVGLSLPSDWIGGVLPESVERVVWDAGLPEEDQVILEQPAPASLEIGEPLNLTVMAEGEGFRYFWRHNGVPLSGESGSSLVLPAVGEGQSGWYTVVIYSNDRGYIVSDSVKVTVGGDAFLPSAEEEAEVPLEVVEALDDPNTRVVPILPSDAAAVGLSVPEDWIGESLPDAVDRVVWDDSVPAQEKTIVVQPQPVSRKWRDPLNLTVMSSDDGARYFWRHNGVPMSDQSGASLELSSIGPEQAGWYTALVYSKETMGFEVSDSVKVSVEFESPLQSTIGEGAAVLRWTAPESREDGQSIDLRDIAAYRIYHGSEALGWVAQYDIPNKLIDYYNSWTISYLVADRHWFAISAIDTQGRESEPSIVGYKDIL